MRVMLEVKGPDGEAGKNWNPRVPAWLERFVYSRITKGLMRGVDKEMVEQILEQRRKLAKHNPERETE